MSTTATNRLMVSGSLHLAMMRVGRPTYTNRLWMNRHSLRRCSHSGARMILL